MDEHEKRSGQLIQEVGGLRERIESERLQTQQRHRLHHQFLQIASRHHECRPMLEEVLALIQDFTGCVAVGLRRLDDDGNIPYAVCRGFSPTFYERENPLSITKDRCMCIKVISGETDPALPFYTPGGSFYMNGTTGFLATISEEEKGKTRNECNKAGYESVALVPIQTEDKIFGLIHLADPRENMVPLETVELLEEAADLLAVAIQRIQTEESLRQNEKFQAAMLNSLIAHIAVLDSTGRIRAVNEPWLRFARENGIADVQHIGVGANYLEATRVAAVAGDSVAAAALDGIEVVIQGRRQNFVIEYRCDSPEKQRWFLMHVTASVDGIGGAIVTHTDITKRKQVEEEVRVSRARLLEAQEVAQLGFYILDFSHGCWSSSEVLDRIFDIPSDYARTVEGWGNLVHPDDRQSMLDYFRDEVCGKQKPFDREYRIVRHGDNQVRWVRGHGRLEFDAAGRLTVMLGTIQDITDRKQAEEEKLELERRLLHAQKLESLGVLAGGIAHDFNNILAGIIGYADLSLVRLPPAEPVRADIELIKKAAQRAADLTRQMLAYSGKGKFLVEPLNLSRVVEDSKKMLTMSVSKKARVTYDLAASLPAVEADAAQLCQVVMNLVINASESLGDQCGAIVVSTSVFQCDAKELAGMMLGQDLPAGPYVCLEVADTGCGMDEQTAARIFDPFFTTKFLGRGLGLAAVHGIVRSHKGTIQLSSEPGKGTTFRVFFPASGPEATAAGDGPLILPGRCSGTVLVVDDEEMIRTLAQEMFHCSGFSALTASGGREAVRLFRERQDEVDCILLDLTMPDMDGVDTFRELRQIRPDIRVVLSSGYSEEAAIERFAGQGLAGFIQKPYQLETLIARIQEVLGA